MVLGLLLPYTAYKSSNKSKGEAGLRDAVQVVQKYMEPGDAIVLPDWPFAEDYINPDAVGVRYYGFVEEQMQKVKYVLVDVDQVRTVVTVPDADVAAFLEAGYTKAHVLGVVLAVAWKTISNYANHLAETELNEAFAQFAWKPPARAA